MDFTLPAHFTTGVLSGDDLKFFYYDICLDNLQGYPDIYDWGTVVAEFKEALDIDACDQARMPDEFVINTIRFTVSTQKNSDNGSKSAAFFRHLRNAFSHYHIVRENNNYIISDFNDNGITMKGYVEVRLLKELCFRFFTLRDK